MICSKVIKVACAIYLSIIFMTLWLSSANFCNSSRRLPRISAQCTRTVSARAEVSSNS